MNFVNNIVCAAASSTLSQRKSSSWYLSDAEEKDMDDHWTWDQFAINSEVKHVWKCPLLSLLNEEYASNLFTIDVEVKFPFQETLHLPLEIVKLHWTIKNSNVVSYFTQNM